MAVTLAAMRRSGVVMLPAFRTQGISISSCESYTLSKSLRWTTPSAFEETCHLLGNSHLTAPYLAQLSCAKRPHMHCWHVLQLLSKPLDSLQILRDEIVTQTSVLRLQTHLLGETHWQKRDGSAIVSTNMSGCLITWRSWYFLSEKGKERNVVGISLGSEMFLDQYDTCSYKLIRKPYVETIPLWFHVFLVSHDPPSGHLFSPLLWCEDLHFAL